jgi:hypothetical protein
MHDNEDAPIDKWADACEEAIREVEKVRVEQQGDICIKQAAKLLSLAVKLRYGESKVYAAEGRLRDAEERLKKVSKRSVQTCSTKAKETEKGKVLRQDEIKKILVTSSKWAKELDKDLEKVFQLSDSNPSLRFK